MSSLGPVTGTEVSGLSCSAEGFCMGVKGCAPGRLSQGGFTGHHLLHLCVVSASLFLWSHMPPSSRTSPLIFMNFLGCSSPLKNIQFIAHGTDTTSTLQQPWQIGQRQSWGRQEYPPLEILGADFAILFVQIGPNQCVSWPENVSKQSWYEVSVQNEWDFHFTGAKGRC